MPTHSLSEAHLPEAKPSDALTFLDHVFELRQRLLWSASAWIIGLLLGFWWALPVIRLLEAQALRTVGAEAGAEINFVQLTAGEVLMTACRVSLVLGTMISSPVWLYQVIRFILPGLLPKERSWLLLAVLLGTGLFVLGVGFAYWLVMPSTLSFFLGFGQEVARQQISVGSFVDFCVLILLLTGLMFELPLFMLMLAGLNLVSSALMLSHWREAVVGIFIAAAVITPSQDPLTMSLVGIVLVVLYLLTLIPLRLMGR